MADKFSGSKNGFGNRTIIDMLEKPASTHTITEFSGLMGGSSTVTLNSADKTSNVSLSNGDLTQTKTADGYGGVRTTDSIPVDAKVYFELTVSGTTTAHYGVGGGSTNMSNWLGSDVTSWAYRGASSTTKTYHNSVEANTGIVAANNGDVVGCAVDMVNGDIFWHVNGSWILGRNPASTNNGVYNNVTGTLYPIATLYENGTGVTWNFGATSFDYSIPTGYTSFNSGFSTGFVTDDSNNIDLSGKSLLSKARYKGDVPWNGSIKMLVSFDHRVTWKYWSGTEWVNAGGLVYTNAATIGDTMAALEMYRVVTGTDTYLDFAIKGVAGSTTPAMQFTAIEVR